MWNDKITLIQRIAFLLKSYFLSDQNKTVEVFLFPRIEYFTCEKVNGHFGISWLCGDGTPKRWCVDKLAKIARIIK